MDHNQSTTKAKSGMSTTTTALNRKQEQQQPTQVIQHSKKKKSKNKNKKLLSTSPRQEKEEAVVTDLGLTKDENLMINGKTLNDQLSLKLHIDNRINGLPVMTHNLEQSNKDKNKVVDAIESYTSLEHGQFDAVNGHGDYGTVKTNHTECTTKSVNVASNKKTKRKPNNKKNLPLNITMSEPLSCRELINPASKADSQLEPEKDEEKEQLNEQKLSHIITLGSNGLPLQKASNSDSIQNIYEVSNTTATQISSASTYVSETIIHETDDQKATDDRTNSRAEEETSIVSEVAPTLQPEVDLKNIHIEYKEYESELQMHDIMRLIQAELSEPYSIYTYRYFIYNWPKLCFLASHGDQYVGAIVCKLDMYLHIRRGYIAMLAVRKEYRKLKIGTTLVQKAIEAMLADAADEVVLETEMSNVPALRLYENLGFVRDKRLFRYYLNGVDALRLKLWFR